MKWRQHEASVNFTQYALWKQMKRLALSNVAKRGVADIDIESIPISSLYHDDNRPH